MTEKLVGHVISHTHWDRAWYLPFEVLRLRLTKLVKKLLRLLEEDEEYVFNFDGQTVPLDDYLEIYPGDRPRIERFVREGRLLVGPFYCLPDQFLITAESLIRNISIGRKEAAALGRVQMEGALSDVFGHPSQIPQILAGFGIRSAIIARGFGPEEKARGWVQKWRAPDGRSSVLVYFCPAGGYANMYYWGMDSFDPEMYPTIPVDADEWSADLAERHLERLIEAYGEGRMTTRELYLGNGVDHQEAQPHTPRLVEEMNRRRGDIRLVHSTYERMMHAVRAEGRRLPVIEGPLPSRKLYGTMTSRVYLHRDYWHIASRTEMLAEPLLACVGVCGRGHRAFRELHQNAFTFNPGQNWAAFPRHPAGELEHLWKLLLKNAPHDDICGCSVDATHRDMENRFKRAREICDYLVSDALLVAASRITSEMPDSPVPALVAFNPHPFAHRERMELEVFLPARGGEPGPSGDASPGAGLASRLAADASCVRLVDSEGAPVPLVVEEARPATRGRWNGNSWEEEPASGMSLRLSFLPELPPSSFAAFRLVEESRVPGGEATADRDGASGGRAAPREGQGGSCDPEGVGSRRAGEGGSEGHERMDCGPDPSAPAEMRDGAAVVENRFYRLRVLGNGSLELHDRKLGKRFRKLCLLEDVEDVGDSYDSACFDEPGEPARAGDEEGRVRILSTDAISTKVEVELRLRLPADLADGGRRRSRRRVVCPARILYEIPHYRKAVRLRVEVENRARHHQLFLSLPTGLRAGEFEYDTKFDIGRYEVGEDEARIDNVAIAAEGARAFGLVVDCPTLLQSEKGPGGRVKFSASVLRSVDRVNSSIPKDYWPADEALCLRRIVRDFELATGRYEAVRRSCLESRRTMAAPAPVVAVTPARELRYRDRRHTGLDLPLESLIRLEGDDLHLSCWKAGGDAGTWTVRVYSLAGRAQTAKLSAALPVEAALECDLDERPLAELRPDGAGRFPFQIGDREIKTLLLRLDGNELERAVRQKELPARQ